MLRRNKGHPQSTSVTKSDDGEKTIILCLNNLSSDAWNVQTKTMICDTRNEETI